jgi:hypothetical protein
MIFGGKMQKVTSLVALFGLLLTFTTIDAQLTPTLAGYCPGQPGGKCPTPKKTSKSRKDFTPEQRKKIMEDARQVCIKAYGASSSVYRFDYKKWRVICYRPGM